MLRYWPVSCSLASPVRIGATALLALSGFLTLSSMSSAQSFDCRAASTASEEAICRHHNLGALDEELLRVYRLAIEASGNADGVKATGRTMWAERQDCMGDVSCLQSAYNAAIAHFSAQADGEEVLKAQDPEYDASDAIAATGAPDSGRPAYFTVVPIDVPDGYINVRLEPGLDTSIVGTLPAGDAVDQVYRCIGPTGGSRKGWCNIRDDDLEGWSSITGLATGVLGLDFTIEDEAGLLMPSETQELQVEVKQEFHQRIGRRLGATTQPSHHLEGANPDILVAMVLRTRRETNELGETQVILSLGGDIRGNGRKAGSLAGHHLTLCCGTDAIAGARFPDRGSIYRAMVRPIEDELGAGILEVFWE